MHEKITQQQRRADVFTKNGDTVTNIIRFETQRSFLFISLIFSDWQWTDVPDRGDSNENGRSSKRQNSTNGNNKFSYQSVVMAALDKYIFN